MPAFLAARRPNHFRFGSRSSEVLDRLLFVVDFGIAELGVYHLAAAQIDFRPIVFGELALSGLNAHRHIAILVLKV
jgi:hypothetical protein